jgi:hypothetical protein
VALANRHSFFKWWTRYLVAATKGWLYVSVWQPSDPNIAWGNLTQSWYTDMSRLSSNIVSC